MKRIIENDIELWVIEILQSKGFIYIPPERMDPDHTTDLRSSLGDGVIVPYLFSALVSINPHLSPVVLQQAVKELTRIPGHGDLINGNQYFQTLLTDGVDVTFTEKGEECTRKAKLVDDVNPQNNLWHITHQVTIIENGQHKRPDVILYLNGLPVIVLELMGIYPIGVVYLKS